MEIDSSVDGIGVSTKEAVVVVVPSSLTVDDVTEFKPANYKFKLYGLDSNGDPHLPLLGREEQDGRVRNMIWMSPQKLTPIIISTSRGMGKTFLLRKLGANDAGSSIKELEDAKNNGRTVSFTAGMLTVEKYRNNHELWQKDLFCSHLSQVFVGHSFKNVKFVKTYANPLLEDLSMPSESFRELVKKMRSMTALNVYELVMNWTREAFNITSDIRLVILIDEMQFLLDGLDKTRLPIKSIELLFIDIAKTNFHYGWYQFR